MARTKAQNKRANAARTDRLRHTAHRAQARTPITLAEVDAQIRGARRRTAPRTAGTSAVFRMVGTGATGHKGAEVAKALATGEWRMQRKGGSDAAGPLKDDVGCTLQRGGPMDYIDKRRVDVREFPNQPEGQTARRAAQIGRYASVTKSGNC